jgi:hypothetical protein
MTLSSGCERPKLSTSMTISTSSRWHRSSCGESSLIEHEAFVRNDTEVVKRTSQSDCDRIQLNRDPEELIAIDQALDHIAIKKPRAAQVGELLVFVGLGLKEAAALLNVSQKTVQRDIDDLAIELHLLGYEKKSGADKCT